MFPVCLFYLFDIKKLYLKNNLLCPFVENHTEIKYVFILEIIFEIVKLLLLKKYFDVEVCQISKQHINEHLLL